MKSTPIPAAHPWTVLYRKWPRTPAPPIERLAHISEGTISDIADYM